MAAIALTGVLFFWGWRRGLAADYTRIVGRTDRRALAVAAEIRKTNKRRLARHTLSQIPYQLPALLACGVVLYRYVLSSVEWSSSLTNNAAKLMTLLRTPLPDGTITLLLLVVTLIHAPLAFFRKLRSAALLYTLYGERAERRKGANHAA